MAAPTELRDITNEWNRMKASLRAVDTVEVSDRQVQAWVRQLREINYDTEDIIDKLKLLPDLSGTFPLLNKFCCVLQKLESSHTADLAQIKDRIAKSFEWQLNNRDRIDRMEQGSSSSSYTASDALLLESTDLVGIDGLKEQLINWLTQGSNSNRKVISVVGTGGSGKSTLVKQVYDTVQGNSHFLVQAWVTISQPSLTRELLRYVVQQIYSATEEPVPAGFDDMNDERLQLLIKSFLNAKSYLIVLDNVWHVKEWHALNHALASTGNRCGRVILTTQKTYIARTCCREPEDHIFNLEPLSKQDSWDLFSRKSFKGSQCPANLEDISRRILERCEGSPLAIMAISGLLVSKMHTHNVVDQWERVLRCLGDEIFNNDDLNRLKLVLLPSFHNLPDNLKYCFMYLCIFPENEDIEKWRLIRMWKAEALVQVKEGLTPEEAAEEHLQELLDRSLMQVVTKTVDGRVKTCRISHVWREMVIFKSRDWNFFVVANEQNAGCSSESTRRIAIHNTMKNGFGEYDVSSLRSLIIFNIEDLSNANLRYLLLSGYRVMRVLDLRGKDLEVFPVVILKLKLLIYLSLRGTKIKTIPSSIEKLRNLETLDLKQTYVAELPNQILKLIQLRHLLVYRYEFGHNHRLKSKHGLKALLGIQHLKFLQKLCFIRADNEQLIEQIGELTQLQRLGILDLEEKNGRLLCSSIKKLTKLQALSVVSSRKDEVIDLGSLSPAPPLQRLDLTGKLKKIPDWVSSLRSLFKIRLKWSRLDHDPLDSLQGIPNLLQLELLQACYGDTLSFKAKGFPNLKILGIDELEQLKSIEVENGAMPCLEKMGIFRCKLLERVPSGIQHLSTLKRLDLFDVSEDLMNSLRPGVAGGDYSKVANIPDVYFTYFRNGEQWEVHHHLGSSGEERVLDALETAGYKAYLEEIWSK